MGRSYGGHMTRDQAAFSLGDARGSFAGIGGGAASVDAARLMAARKSTSATRRRASAAPARATSTTRRTRPALRATGHLLVGLLGRRSPEVVGGELAEGRADQ